MEMSEIPYDPTNPHHARLVRQFDRPLQSVDKHGRASDISCVAPVVTLFNTVDETLVKQYVKSIASYTNMIDMLGTVMLCDVAKTVGGADFEEVLRQYGLLSSPHRMEHERIKRVAHHLAVHTKRTKDADIAKVCVDWENCVKLLR